MKSLSEYVVFVKKRASRRRSRNLLMVIGDAAGDAQAEIGRDARERAGNDYKFCHAARPLLSTEF